MFSICAKCHHQLANKFLHRFWVFFFETKTKKKKDSRNISQPICLQMFFKKADTFCYLAYAIESGTLEFDNFIELVYDMYLKSRLQAFRHLQYESEIRITHQKKENEFTKHLKRFAKVLLVKNTRLFLREVRFYGHLFHFQAKTKAKRKKSDDLNKFIS